MMVIVLVLFVIGIAYYLLKLNYAYWKRRGVPGPQPVLFFGNMLESFLMKKSMGEIYAEIYRKYPKAPIVGLFRATSPALIIRDPELIKDITIKQFNNFHDNDIEIDMKADPLFGRNPFVLNGALWKTVRTQLTPTFTSGKMKIIYPLLEDVSKKLVKFINDQPDATSGQGLEAKEICARFTLNNIATCTFGLEGKCFEDPNSEFRQIGERYLTPTGWNSFKLFIVTLIPSLVNIVSVKFTPKDVEQRIIDLVVDTLKYRQDNHIVRNDFLHMMNQLKFNAKQEFTDVDIAAHAAGFFVDGFETSSVTMSFFLYHLANNPKIQATLRAEINELTVKYGNDLPYDVLQKATYLDACLNESLRMHPPLMNLIKRCTEPYTYVAKPEDCLEKPSMTVEKGTSIVFSLTGLHNDPKYFENPKTYMPERFLPENRDKFETYSFLPFGKGPRTCLGQSFGILQLKAGVAYLVKNFEMSVNTKTQIPFKYDSVYCWVSPIGGIWIDFRKLI